VDSNISSVVFLGARSGGYSLTMSTYLCWLSYGASDRMLLDCC